MNLISKNKITFIFLFSIFLLPAYGANKDTKAIYELIERVTPGYSSQYRLEIIAPDNGVDVYEVDGNGKEIILRGNTPVALATAFNWYLKYTCQAHVSWFGNQLNLPEKLPQPRERERRVINGRYRVYMNYCTVSYTAAWWDWERWQKELDFMAMNSVNMPLFTIGLDAVWYNTLLHFNFSDREARAFLAGPGHAAWQWMQNLQSYGGPLPKSVIDRHAALGKKIIARQLELGMQPIQQGFSGYVPRELKDKYPTANINQQRSWCGFKGAAQLDPTDSLFTRMGRVFLEEQARLFGAHGVYAADPFHESAPPVDTPEYLKAVGETIHRLFREFDPQSTWAMQSWSLREAIVKAVPKEALLILDLRGSSTSKAEFWGYPTVVGTLHNFGGRINMHGDLALLASNQYSKAKRLNPAVCGSGLFMEAIEQNPVYYELAFEMPCHPDSIDLRAWLKQYATRRYGAFSPATQKAWMLLLEGPYRQGTNGTEKSSIVAARPALDVKKSGPNAGLEIPYDPALIIRAQSLLLEDADKLSASRPYRFDLVDVQRQMMTNLGQLIHRKAAEAFRSKDREAFTLHSERFLGMLADMDTLLRTRSEYSFDRWLTEARSWGETEEEKNQMERDATSLVTIWGADGDPRIFDYSWREWAGLINGYYLPRWQKFYTMLQQHLDEGTSYEEAGLPQIYGREAFRANDFYHALAEWELSYVDTYGKARIPATEGDEIDIVKRLFKKYFKLSQEYYTDSIKLIKPSRDERTYENLGEDL